MYEQRQVTCSDRPPEGVEGMAKTGDAVGTGGSSGAGAGSVGVESSGLGQAFRRLRAEVAAAALDALDDDQRLDLLRDIEDLTRSLGATTARVQVAFAHSQLEAQKSRGVPQRRRGKALAADLATARKTSPYWGSRELAGARVLVEEMPHTLAALEDAEIDAFQARSITEATTCLSREDRAEVDRRLRGQLAGASTKEIVAAARALTYEIDPAGFVARARKAAKDRGLSIRPAPDVMALLSARMTAVQAIAVYKVLRDHADSARASGDPRTRNQLMVDELFARVTGRTVVDGVDVEVGVVMTDAALFGGGSDAAEIIGYGPIPASMARDLLREQGDTADDHGASQRAGAPATDGSTAERTGAPERSGRPEPGNAPEPTSDESPTPAGRPEFCPAGPRCTDAACTLLHGVPPSDPPGGPPKSSTDSSASSSTPPTPEASSSPAPRPSPAAEPPPSPPPPAPPSSEAVRTAKVWLRRLYADPVTGCLTVRDPRRRLFTGALRALIIARDRVCRNSWCGAPIRDVDHIVPHREGGRTDEDGGQGLCQYCNLAKERERHRPPGPDDYRPAPPILDSFLGRSAAGLHQPDLARPA